MEGQENATADFHAGSAAFPQAYSRAGMFVVESGAGARVVPAIGPGLRRRALAVYRALGGMPVAAKGYTLFLMANEE